MTKRATASYDVPAVAKPRRVRSLKVKKEASELARNREAGGRARRPNLPRSWDEKASRAIRLKLAGFPLQQVRNNKNSKGQMIHPVVKEAMQKLGGARKIYHWPFGKISSRILTFVEAMLMRSLRR